MTQESGNLPRRDYYLAILTVSHAIARRHGITEPGPTNIGGIWYRPNEFYGLRLGTKVRGK